MFPRQSSGKGPTLRANTAKRQVYVLERCVGPTGSSEASLLPWHSRVEAEPALVSGAQSRPVPTAGGRTIARHGQGNGDDGHGPTDAPPHQATLRHFRFGEDRRSRSLSHPEVVTDARGNESLPRAPERAGCVTAGSQSRSASWKIALLLPRLACIRQKGRGDAQSSVAGQAAVERAAARK